MGNRKERAAEVWDEPKVVSAEALVGENKGPWQTQASVISNKDEHAGAHRLLVQYELHCHADTRKLSEGKRQTWEKGHTYLVSNF